MRMSKLTVSLVAAIGLTVIGGSGALAQAQKTFTLKFNHVLGPKEPYHDGFLKWAKRVEERTKGGLKIDVFHSAQLGIEEDIIEQIRQGANIGQNTDSARMGNYVPGIAVMNGPYFAETLEDVAKLRKSPTVQQVAGGARQQVRPEGAVASTGCRAIGTSSPTSRSGRPDDLKGLRIRTPPAPIWQESIRALGADAGRDGLRRDVSGPAAAGDRRRRARLQQHPGRALLRGAEVRQRDQAHHADQLRGGQREVVRQPAEGVPGHPGRGVRQGRRRDLAARSSGSRPRSSSSSRGAA